MKIAPPSNSTFHAALRTKMPMNADFDFLSTAAMRESLPPCCRAMRIDGLQNRRSKEISTRDALPEDRLIQSAQNRSEEHTSELQSLMRISYAVFCLKNKRHEPKTAQT